MRSTRPAYALACIAAAAIAIAVAPHAQAGDVFTLARTANPASYTPGIAIEIEVTLELDTAAQLNAVGLEETLPAGWVFDGLAAGTAPSVAPGAGEGGLLEFAWFPLPSFPLGFTYRVLPPPDATGTKQIAGSGLVLLQGIGELRSPGVNTVIPKEGSGPFHSGDIDLSQTISLSELLRLIQFYNILGLHCADFPGQTEDGYVPGLLGSKACGPHNSDYNPQDWRVDLSELLRAIQFYNTGALYACPEENTEDGFCPGLQP